MSNNIVNSLLKGVDDKRVQIFIYAQYRYKSKHGLNLSHALIYEKETGDVIGKNLPEPDDKINPERILPALLEACPTFQSDWDLFLKTNTDEKPTFQPAMSEFAIHVADLFLKAEVENFVTIFGVLEEIMKHCSPYEQNSIVTGFLEDLQNIIGNQDDHPDQLMNILGQTTKLWWDEINRFWADLEKYYESNSNIFALIKEIH